LLGPLLPLFAFFLPILVVVYVRNPPFSFPSVFFAEVFFPPPFTLPAAALSIWAFALVPFPVRAISFSNECAKIFLQSLSLLTFLLHRLLVFFFPLPRIFKFHTPLSGERGIAFLSSCPLCFDPIWLPIFFFVLPSCCFSNYGLLPSEESYSPSAPYLWLLIGTFVKAGSILFIHPLSIGLDHGMFGIVKKSVTCRPIPKVVIFTMSGLFPPIPFCLCNAPPPLLPAFLCPRHVLARHIHSCKSLRPLRGVPSSYSFCPPSCRFFLPQSPFSFVPFA